jgi:hypothetical protein
MDFRVGPQIRRLRLAPFGPQQADLRQTPLLYRTAWNTMTSVKWSPSICQA